MRPRPRAPRAYTRFLPCRIVHRRGRAPPAHPRPADRPPRASPGGRHSPASRHAHLPRRRYEAHPARRRSLRPPACVGQSSCPCAGQPRPTGVGRPGSWVWLGVRTRSRCGLPHPPPPSPAPGVHVSPLISGFRLWVVGWCGYGPPSLRSYTAIYTPSTQRCTLSIQLYSA